MSPSFVLIPILFLLPHPYLSSPTGREVRGLGEGDDGMLPGEIEAYRDALIFIMNILDDGITTDKIQNRTQDVIGEQSINHEVIVPDSTVGQTHNIADSTVGQTTSSRYNTRRRADRIEVGGVDESTVVIVVEDDDYDPNDMTLASFLYEEDTPWGACTRSCRTRRSRPCKLEEVCGTESLNEEAFCYAPESRCQTQVLEQLEAEGYIIVEDNEDDVLGGGEEGVEDEVEDYWYVPDPYEFDVDEDQEYDYGWADYLAQNDLTEDELLGFVPVENIEPDYVLYDYGDTEEGEEAQKEEEEAHQWTEEPEEVEEGEEEGREEPEEVEEEGEVDESWECGKKGKKRSFHRIIGGREAREGEWPWAVAVLNRFKETFCGGTLISPQWVLTAAHCVRSRLYVRLAEHDLMDYDEDHIEMRVSEIIKHPGYDEDEIVNDIALLKLPRRITLSRRIRPACLPENSTEVVSVDKKCVVAGWGKERESHIFGSNVLNYARVPIVPRSLCRKVYPDHNISYRQLCAGFRRGAADTCAGDSGGPMVCDNGNDQWVVQGVTSYGEGCGERGRYGVYSRVASYLPWINSVMDNN